MTSHIVEMSDQAKEIHVHTTAHAIGIYMGGDRSNLICYRCGQTGHVRFQCLQYKIRLCQHFERGECNERFCSFAHGEGELRTPWKLRCVRVVKLQGKVSCIGCHGVDHTFKKCPNVRTLPAIQRALQSDEDEAEHDPPTPTVVGNEA